MFDFILHHDYHDCKDHFILKIYLGIISLIFLFKLKIRTIFLKLLIYLNSMQYKIISYF